MKSMIFAAGLGTRLKPITDTLPKALVPVCGRPLIEHTCRKLMSAGINEAVVNIHHFADKIEDWANGQDWIAVAGSAQAGNLSQEDKSDMFGVTFSDERAQLLETGGAVLHARPFLEGCGHFLIHNVDILSNADLQWLQS
jgi:NDP-sugar pyrophosphorylase family protein